MVLCRSDEFPASMLTAHTVTADPIPTSLSFPTVRWFFMRSTMGIPFAHARNIMIGGRDPKRREHARSAEDLMILMGISAHIPIIEVSSSTFAMYVPTDKVMS